MKSIDSSRMFLTRLLEIMGEHVIYLITRMLHRIRTKVKVNESIIFSTQREMVRFHFI